MAIRNGNTHGYTTKTGSRATEAEVDLRRTGFTLAEVVAVLAALSLLSAVLVPSMQQARRVSRELTCAETLAGLGSALALYAADHDGWIPGMNTSGVAVRVYRYAAGGNPDVLHQSDLPVQGQDWMTPLARYEHDLPANRAERWHFLWSQYRCPQMRAWPAYPPVSDTVPDWDEFFVALWDSWPPCSYLMPACFQFWGQDHDNIPLAPCEGTTRWVNSVAAPDYWEVINYNYLSRLDQVGPPARKIFAADGTRYLTQEGILDYDLNPFSSWFGNFASAGGWWTGSTTYGVRTGSLNWGGHTVPSGSPSEGRNLLLSYRHVDAVAAPRPTGSAHNNVGKINTAFFDGHVELLGDEASRAIDMWYPTGSVVQQYNEGMTTVPAGYVIP